MKKLMTMLLVCCFVFPLVLMAQKGSMAVPAGADLERYPIYAHPLTASDQAKLGLRVIALDHPWTGYNWFGKNQRFAYETLRAGTLVLVDYTGEVRYKVDCGNRLVAIPTEKTNVVYPTLLPEPTVTPTKKGPFGKFLDGLWEAAKNTMSLAGGIGTLLIALALLALMALLVGYGIYRIAQWLRHRSDPAPVPAATPKSSDAAQPAIAPVSEATTDTGSNSDAPGSSDHVVYYAPTGNNGMHKIHLGPDVQHAIFRKRTGGGVSILHR